MFCSCSERLNFIHSWDCVKANAFLSKFKGHMGIMENDEDKMRICCCSPEIDHCAEMKVKIYYKNFDSEVLNSVPFKFIAGGSLRYAGNLQFKELPYKQFSLVGLERVLHQIYNSITVNKKRVIMMYGEPGSGKTPVVKQICNLLYERRAVTGVKYINMDKCNNLNVFKARIARGSNFLNHKSYLENIPDNEESLVILENIDFLVDNNKKEFFKLLAEILENKKLKFLIVFRNKHTIESKNHGMELQYIEELIQLPSVSSQKAARLLQILTNGEIISEMFSLTDLQAHPVLTIKPGQKLTPGRVFDIAFLYKRGLQLSQICEILDKDPKHNKVVSTDEKAQPLVSLLT